MADVEIRLDTKRASSECRGDRAHDDPHYKVHSWQGFRIGKTTVQLPFDATGLLVPDDGRNEPFAGTVDGKPVMHHPLYSKAMRECVAAKRKALASMAADASEQEEADTEADDATEEANAVEEVNFVAWLKGDLRYPPDMVKKAAKKRFGRNYTDVRQMVIDFVDEGFAREAEVTPLLAKYLKQQAA